MMRKVFFVGSVCLFLVPALVLVGCGGGDEDGAKAGAQTICPVMGQKIDKKYYVDYKGKRVYFCCEGCPATFNADPEKYMKKLADSGAILEEMSEDHSSHAH
jgi:YHS domain-containing protein